MGKSNIIRVRPISFETDWRTDMKAVGVKVPKAVPETRYTPVNHDPMPYSLAVDLNAKRVVRRIVGVMPNAMYNGKIYSWDEFCALLVMSQEEQMVITSNVGYSKRLYTVEEFYALIDRLAAGQDEDLSSSECLSCDKNEPHSL